VLALIVVFVENLVLRREVFPSSRRPGETIEPESCVFVVGIAREKSLLTWF
jgi:hypothetical protein